MVKALTAPGLARLSRKELDDLTEFAAVYGAKGLAWVKLVSNGWQSPLAKFFPAGVKKALTDHLGAKEGIFSFSWRMPPKWPTPPSGTAPAPGQARGLIPEDQYNFLWVTDFPLLEFDLQEGRYAAMHHPFTAPQEDDIPLLETQPGRVRARAYDLVLNGRRSAAAASGTTGGMCRSRSSPCWAFPTMKLKKNSASCWRPWIRRPAPRRRGLRV